MTVKELIKQLEKVIDKDKKVQMVSDKAISGIQQIMNTPNEVYICGGDPIWKSTTL